MIVDAHVHVGSWNHTDFLGRECELQGTLAELGAAGVDGAAIMPSDRCDNDALLGEARAAIALGHRGPLWFFPWVRPLGHESHTGEGDLAWAEAHAADITGFKIHPSLSRVKITDVGFRPYLELAEARGLVVLVHCGRWAEMAGWAHALEAAARHPKAKFLLAHAGGDTPPNATHAAEAVFERKLENVWFEFSGLREYWVIERNVRRIGAARYLLGSDYPLAHPRMYLGSLEAMALSSGERALIAGGNAVSLFGESLR